MSISHKVDEMNARLFALEGRMTTFEKAAMEDREYRKEVHDRLIKGQKETDARLRKIDAKLAFYAGALALLAVLLRYGDIFKFFIKSP